MASSLDKRDIDDDIYNDLVVLSYLIDEAADLSQRNHTSSLPSFEEIFAQERLLARCNGGHAELDEFKQCTQLDGTQHGLLIPKCDHVFAVKRNELSILFQPHAFSIDVCSQGHLQSQILK